MKITHKIDSFLAALFPNYKESNNDLGLLKAEVAKYYSIRSILNQIFYGYKTLSYYYVRWAISMPNEEDKLGLEYEKEYKIVLRKL